MPILIKGAEIIDQTSPFHRKKKNILIKNGIIKEIGDTLYQANHIIDATNCQLSIGWFDLDASFSDPGFEHKENIESGCKTAAAAGFTDVAVQPNTNPIIQSKNEVLYLIGENKNHLTKIHPIAAATKDFGNDIISEMIDLHTSGAVAFSNGDLSIQNANTLLKILRYLQKTDALFIHHAEDKSLSKSATMHEGVISTSLGLQGIPPIAEEICISRDLKLLEYCNGKIHFSNISTAKSVDLIRKAKKDGLNVSCDIAAHQLAFTENDLKTFDTNFKTNPPFRTQEDIDALLEGLKDDTIDCIVSAHRPQDIESKNVAFDEAAFGIISLQTVYPILNQFEKILSIEKIIDKIAYQPRKRLNIPIPSIQVGQKATLTLFNPNKTWELNDQTNLSKSKNSPLYHKTLKGKPIAIFNRNKFEHFE